MGHGIGPSKQDGFYLAMDICCRLVPCDGDKAGFERGAAGQGEQVACRRRQQDKERAGLTKEEKGLSCVCLLI